MIQYSLENHLEQLCNKHPEYTSLLSTWRLNKETCADALKTVVTSYPHFSLHDVSHAESVATKIEMLLGDRVERLSPTDTWLILHAAYAHDLGMVLKWVDIEEIWKTPKFTQFIQALIGSTDVDLSKAAKNINALINRKEDAVFDPLVVSRNVTLINAAYFRRYHSEISRKYIDLWKEGLEIDFGHSGLIQSRLIKLLGLICELHTSDSDKVLKLDYQTDGFGTDYAHPRFVASMLRLGDLLDADNGRFSTTATMTIGALPDSSLAHRDKHESTIHLLVTPTDIEFRSDCSTQSAYLETRNFISWLESEIEFLKKNWDLVAPKDLGGYVPRFDKKEVLLNGIPDIEGVADLRFRISQEKAFQIVEGSNIYGNPFVCFREIIQNAMDASKIQMWKDLTAGNYSAWIDDEKISKNMQPFDIDKAILNNYSIYVKLSTLADGKTQVDISDRGTGISISQFKQMCNVGKSTSLNGDNELFIETMPGWLKPTAGFGIGLQSIFLLVDKFEIITSTGTEAFTATVHSYRSGGYLQLRREKDVPARGTTIRVTFDSSKYPDPIMGESRKYLYEQYDPFSDEDYIGESHVIGSILEKCTDSMFPIRVSSSIDKYRDTTLIQAMNIDENEFTEKKGCYRYALSKDCCKLTAWDERNHIRTEIELAKLGYPPSEFRFKGVSVSRGRYGHGVTGLKIILDVYGLDTKTTLSLDRASFIQPGSKIIMERLNEAVNLYIECVLNELKKSSERLKEICANPHFNVYTFWLACSPNQRTRIPVESFLYIKETVEVVCCTDNKKHTTFEKPINELLTGDKTVYFAWTWGMDDIPSNSKNAAQVICNILDESGYNNSQEFVVDKWLCSTNETEMWNAMIQPSENSKLIIYTTGSEACCKVSQDFRQRIIRGLVAPIHNLERRDYADTKIMHRAIPAIGEYEDIAVGDVPRGVIRPYTQTNWIIAPFTSQFGSKASEMSKEMFIDSVIKSTRFEKIVMYVQEHRVRENKITIEEIKKCYQKLIEEFYDVITDNAENP